MRRCCVFPILGFLRSRVNELPKGDLFNIKFDESHAPNITARRL